MTIKREGVQRGKSFFASEEDHCKNPFKIKTVLSLKKLPHFQIKNWTFWKVKALFSCNVCVRLRLTQWMDSTATNLTSAFLLNIKKRFRTHYLHLRFCHRVKLWQWLWRRCKHRCYVETRLDCTSSSVHAACSWAASTRRVVASMTFVAPGIKSSGKACFSPRSNASFSNINWETFKQVVKPMYHPNQEASKP